MGHRSPFSPLHPTSTGCPVNRVISHTHLDSCESGPPHPARQPPTPPSWLPGFSWSSSVDSGLTAGFSELPASWQGWPSLWTPLSGLAPSSVWPGPSALARDAQAPSPLSSLSVLPRDVLFLSSLAVGTCSVLTGPRQPPPPLVPSEGALAVISPRPRLAPRAGPWVLRCCHGVNLKQCQVNKTTFPTQELRAHKAPMSGHTGSSVGSPAQSSPHSRPTRCPSPHSPSGAVSAPGGTGFGLLILGSGC